MIDLLPFLLWIPVFGMIEIFEGRLGGGKTYSAVSRILAHLAKGGHVRTNIELNFAGCYKYCLNRYGVEIEEDQIGYFTMDQIEEVHKHLPAGCRGLPVLVVLDEAHLWFNSRDWNKTSREFLAFLTQSRKVDVDFIFISQSANNIDKQFMRLVQYIWRFKDMERLRIPIFGFMWPFPQIFVSQFDYDGKTKLFSEWLTKDKGIFAAYNTNALLKPIQFAGGRLEKKLLAKAARKPFLDPKLVSALKSGRLPAHLRLPVGAFVFYVLLMAKLYVGY